MSIKRHVLNFHNEHNFGLGKCQKVVISVMHHKLYKTCDKRMVPGGRIGYCYMQWNADFFGEHC